MKTDVKIGTKLNLKLDRVSKAMPGTYLVTTFLGEDGEGKFLIDAPMLRTMRFPVQTGETCECSYHDEAANYDFDGEVLERISRGDQVMFSMRQTSEVTRVQRRDDYRLPFTLEGRLVTKDEAKLPIDEPFITVDISGGGLAVKTTKVIDKSLNCEVHMALEPNKPLKVIAEVRWSRRLDNEETGSPWKYSYGLKFLHKDTQQRDYIAKLVFQKQLEQRRRVR